MALDLCNREANQNKQVIIFMPTKSGCRKAVEDLIHYIDSTFPEQPGILSESVPEKVMEARKAVVEVASSPSIESRNYRSSTPPSRCSSSPCCAAFATTTPD